MRSTYSPVSLSKGVNSSAKDFSVKEWMTNDSYYNISEIKLSIITDTIKYDIISTENSNVIDSFISKILKYKSCRSLSPWLKNPRTYYSHQFEEI